jgi:rhodanese-related sulfurtransferase
MLSAMQEKYLLSCSVGRYSRSFSGFSSHGCVEFNLLLIAILVAVLVLIVSPVCAHEIDAERAYSLSTKGELLIIDIRRSSEWRSTGMPATSHGISLQNFLKKVRTDFTKDVVELVEQDMDQPIALICATGGRSAYAMGLLREFGFSRVFNIEEGMLGNSALPGWIARGLPVQKCDGC